MTSLVFLLSSIVLTSWLTLSFKVLGKLRINSLQAIVFNYITCVITGALFMGSFPVGPALVKEPWLPWAVVMGVVFLLLFNLVSYISQRISVAVAAVAFKLSLVIPFLFSLYYYNESASVIRWTGVVLALAAVVLTFFPSGKSKQTGSNTVTLLKWLAPFSLFAGSGVLDSMIKYVEHAYINPANQDAYLVTAFFFASLSGIILLVVGYVSGRLSFSWKTVAAGIAIGIPNYFSIWCLMKALKGFPGDSSAVIPVNNMGIVLLSAVVAWLLFKEKLSAVNWLGIILSLGAIALIAFGR